MPAEKIKATQESATSAADKLVAARKSAVRIADGMIGHMAVATKKEHKLDPAACGLATMVEAIRQGIWKRWNATGRSFSSVKTSAFLAARSSN